METILQNMCMIYDKSSDKILILDKIVKEGWEGLTFVGGHVESGENLYESCVREVFEETGLTVSNLKLRGTVNWIDRSQNKRFLAFLYYTEHFEGTLIEENVEGKLFWMPIKEFKNAKGKSETIDEIFELYMDESINEISVIWDDGKFVECKFFRGK